MALLASVLMFLAALVLVAGHWLEQRRRQRLSLCVLLCRLHQLVPVTPRGLCPIR